jgi:hypothetical protein
VSARESDRAARVNATGGSWCCQGYSTLSPADLDLDLLVFVVWLLLVDHSVATENIARVSRRAGHPR